MGVKALRPAAGPAGAADDERRRMDCWLGVDPSRKRPAPRSACERGEAALLRGDRKTAARELDAALVESPQDSWAYAARAALHFQGADFAAAQEDVERFQRLKPASAAGFAMRALLSAREGDKDSARRALDEAVDRGGQGDNVAWVRALRGALLARWGELAAARADLDAALEVEASPWALAERADVLNRLGFFWLALADLDRARAALPGDPETDLRAAAIHLDQAQYGDALKRLDLVVKSHPKDAGFLRRRAHVRFVQGDGAGALHDIESACALAPEDGELRGERARALMSSGKEKEAERVLAHRAVPPAAKAYGLAYLRCRQKRYGESRALFARAAELAPSPLKEKALFYALVARVLETTPEASVSTGKQLVVAGLGYRQPFQVSPEALSALRASQMFCSNLSDTAVADFLGLFAVPMRAIVFRRADLDAVQCARDVMPGFAEVDRVAVVTRGHPLYYGRLAYRLIVKCRRKGIPVRVPPSVSVGDTIAALCDHARGTRLGWHIRDSSALRSLDSRVPLVLYNFARESGLRARAVGALAGVYPAGHPCSVLAGSSDREFFPDEVPLRSLTAALDKADEAVTVLLPAAGEA